jgi:hypothetical protein
MLSSGGGAEVLPVPSGDGFEAENSINFLGQSILVHNLLSFTLFWLNRVDLRYYWSFNSLFSKNNIKYPQTGHPFHTINADAFSKLELDMQN